MTDAALILIVLDYNIEIFNMETYQNIGLDFTRLQLHYFEILQSMKI